MAQFDSLHVMTFSIQSSFSPAISAINDDEKSSNQREFRRMRFLAVSRPRFHRNNNQLAETTVRTSKMTESYTIFCYDLENGF